ncbi:hypothetical protein [Pimelobacter simplex]|uniref:hypothetical protein n=1 Tax=Nocardioides simplex TaxID=2045 RepID=UPI00214F7312|nr:hypothetical protein [Pimelobacter simplex]UUW89297.1 hypothetical protein M0M43_26720 [Pimelobacter simplex]UUW93125.1 hypothetical protein M0M48_15370 [Pimelobacter simplex]
MAPRRRTGPHAGDERGASAVLIAALLSVVLMVSAAFAVDLGQQRVVRRDVQAVADMVALDMVRLLDGRKAKDYTATAFDDAKKLSLQRNSSALGGELKPADVSWTFAVPGSTAGTWTTVASNADTVPTAIKVTAKSQTGFAFSGFTGVSEGGATRTAVARNEESACFRVGSFIASLDSGQSTLLNPILSALFGSTVNLDLIGYKGLAGANVSLLDLVNLGGLGVGSVDELLKLDGVEVAKIFVAAAKVLENQGKLAAANILRAITVSAATPKIAIADLIQAAPGASSALDASLNVLDLITTAAFVANKNHAVEIPNLGITLPGVASVTTSLTVIEPPKPKCGPVGTESETAQISLRLNAHINPQSIRVGVLDTSVDVGAIDLAVSIDLGKAIAKLTKVTCNVNGPDSLQVALKSGVVGGISITASAGVKARVNPVGGLLDSILGLLGLNSLLKPPYLTLDSSVSINAGSPSLSGYNKTVTVPIPGGYTVPSGSGSGALIGPVSIDPAINTDLVLHYWDGLLILGSWKERHITDPLNTVFDSVLRPLVSTLLSALVNPLVSTLQTALIGPLGKLLGLQVGGADVFAMPTPTCSGPKLVG